MNDPLDKLVYISVENAIQRLVTEGHVNRQLRGQTEPYQFCLRWCRKAFAEGDENVRRDVGKRPSWFVRFDALKKMWMEYTGESS